MQASSLLHGRVVFIGDASVGKTSILNNLFDIRFDEYEPSTVGANYQLFTNDIKNTHVEIQIWDTAGQERYRTLGPIYYRNSIGALVVFDLTSRNSFTNLPSWIQEFTQIADQDAVIYIAGNKSDLKDERMISTNEAQAWAESNGYRYFETSARTGEGIHEMFDALSKEIIQKKITSHGETRSLRGDNERCC
ncbi:small GTP-binding protein [Histomonas meleagridis]|uniref:small GTP-binding protein n=1 Tax=Histomonas meleagridis TaxID=135588 RepID=UPI00355ACD74|nr:small GTP-binding protein [Histomonas meleagridis]KAH0804458.1 small GTP-binding protein [Histomonas meleagridis]